jgi:hypothetical protein
VLATASLLAVARPALARNHGRGAGEVSLRLTLQHMPSLPAGALRQGTSTDLRFYPEDARIPMGNPMTFVGLEGGFAFTLDDRWVLPFLSVGVYAPVGPMPDVLSNIAGSVVRVSPSTGYRMDASFLGLGFRQNDRRFSYGFRIMPYIAFMPSLSSAVLEGNAFTPLSGTRVIWGAVRFEGEACRRLDPYRRACLVVTPSIFEGRWLNGLALSLKVELGS